MSFRYYSRSRVMSYTILSSTVRCYRQCREARLNSQMSSVQYLCTLHITTHMYACACDISMVQIPWSLHDGNDLPNLLPGFAGKISPFSPVPGGLEGHRCAGGSCWASVEHQEYLHSDQQYDDNVRAMY